MEKKMTDKEVIIHIAKEIYVIAHMVASAHARMFEIKKELQAAGKAEENGRHCPDMGHSLEQFVHTARLAADLVEEQCGAGRLDRVSENIKLIQGQSELDLAKRNGKRQIAAFRNQWKSGMQEMEELLEEMAETVKGGSDMQRTAEMLLRYLSEDREHIVRAEDDSHKTYMLVCAMEKASYRTDIGVCALISEMDRQRAVMEKICMELEAALAK